MVKEKEKKKQKKTDAMVIGTWYRPVV